MFDGVICTDVMEHIDRPDIDKTLNDIFSFLNHGKFAFFNICTRSSFKTLPDGRSVHLTVEPAEWWEEKLDRFTRKWDVVATYSD